MRRSMIGAAAGVLALALLPGCKPAPPERPTYRAHGALVFDADAVFGSGRPGDDVRAKAFFATAVGELQAASVGPELQRRLSLPARPAPVAAQRRGDSLILDVSVQSDDPARAATLCNGALEAYVEMRMERALSGLSAETEVLASELDRLDGGAGAESLRQRLVQLDLDRRTRRSDVRVLERCELPARATR